MSLFYTIDPKGKIAISNYGLGKYVQSLGFSKYYLSDEKTITPVYIYKTGNIIEPVSPIRVHETVIKELETQAGSPGAIPVEELPRVVDKLVESKILTSQELLITMDELDKPIISDTSNTGIFPFRNGVVTVSSEGIHLTSISSIDGYLWSSQIIDREFEPLSQQESKRSDFFRFLCNITGNRTAAGWTENPERFASLYSLIGYLLHSYKDPTNPRAVILMDSSLDGAAEGRTGKGLVVKGVNKVRKGMITIDGKDYNGNDRFKFSRVSPETNLIFIDDVGKGFDFENLFSIVTEGIKIEEKYLRSYYIPFDKSPKIVMSTNYTLLGRGSSHEARKYEFALSNYYSSTFTPINEFGKMFFYEWNTTQWNYFDNLMVYAIQSYLSNGVTVASDSNIEEKKLLLETSPEFVEWINEQHLQLGQRYESSEMYETYIRLTGSTIDRKAFIGFLKSYANSNDWVLDQPHSGSVRYLEFKPR